MKHTMWVPVVIPFTSAVIVVAVVLRCPEEDPLVSKSVREVAPLAIVWPYLSFPCYYVLSFEHVSSKTSLIAPSYPERWWGCLLTKIGVSLRRVQRQYRADLPKKRVRIRASCRRTYLVFVPFLRAQCARAVAAT